MAGSTKKKKPDPNEMVLIRNTSYDEINKLVEREINDLISNGWSVKMISTGGGGHASMFHITSVFVMEKKENNISSNIN